MRHYLEMSPSPASDAQSQRRTEKKHRYYESLLLIESTVSVLPVPWDKSSNTEPEMCELLCAD